MKILFFSLLIQLSASRLFAAGDSYSFGSRDFSNNVEDTSINSILADRSKWDGAMVRFYAFVTLNSGERGILNIDLHEDAIAAEMKYCTPSISALIGNSDSSLRLTQDEVGELHHKIVEVMGTILVRKIGAVEDVELQNVSFIRVVGEYTTRPYKIVFYEWHREDQKMRAVAPNGDKSQALPNPNTEPAAHVAPAAPSRD